MEGTLRYPSSARGVGKLPPTAEPVADEEGGPVLQVTCMTPDPERRAFPARRFHLPSYMSMDNQPNQRGGEPRPKPVRPLLIPAWWCPSTALQWDTPPPPVVRVGHAHVHSPREPNQKKQLLSEERCATALDSHYLDTRPDTWPDPATPAYICTTIEGLLRGILFERSSFLRDGNWGNHFLEMGSTKIIS